MVWSDKMLESRKEVKMNSQKPMKMMAFKVMQGMAGRLTSSEWAFMELWQKIVRRELSPGEKISEETLAEMLSISRTPLRDAIRRLEEVGLLVRGRNRYLRVAPLCIKEAEEVSLIREKLESLVAMLAAKNHQSMKKEIGEARLLVDKMKGLCSHPHTPSDVLKLGDEFHAKICQISQAERVESMLSQVYLVIERYRILLNENRDRVGDISSEHDLVLNAIEKGDCDGASQAMASHISRARELYISELKKIIQEKGFVSRGNGR